MNTDLGHRIAPPRHHNATPLRVRCCETDIRAVQGQAEGRALVRKLPQKAGRRGRREERALRVRC